MAMESVSSSEQPELPDPKVGGREQLSSLSPFISRTNCQIWGVLRGCLVSEILQKLSEWDQDTAFI